jgi:hypothetical protein
MSRKFFVINFLISLGIFILTAVFSLNDDFYGWSDRLATIMMAQSLIYALAYNVKHINFWKTGLKKVAFFYFGLFDILYTLILALFCKEHLYAYVSEDLLRIIMSLIMLAGGIILWIYVIDMKKKIDKETTK